MDTCELSFGVPVQRFVRVDFDGFRAVVDAVGGIEVDVEEPVIDDAYPTDDYGVVRIEIPAGRQLMNGETALQYARSRHGSSDFDRTERQQQVLVALASRMTQPGSWTHLPAVFEAIFTRVDTDLRPWEMLNMGVTLLRVGPEGIEHHVIDREMVSPWTTPSGGAVLLPNWELIGPLIQQVFAP
jgi:anionic cell wall polymer biosynthesis LytR-Cps2A-Psr (LCP) family protein